METKVHTITDLCVKMQSLQAAQDVRAVLGEAAHSFDMPFFRLILRTGSGSERALEVVISNYPTDFIHKFEESGAIDFDPVFERALQGAGVFRTEGLPRSSRQWELHSAYVKSGLPYELSASDRGPDGAVAVLSFAGPRQMAPNPSEWEAAWLAMSMLVMATHRALARIIVSRERGTRRKAEISLTNNERRTLEIMAAAVPVDRAAVLLGVSSPTVRYYANRAKNKLGATSRTEALLAAAARGLIRLGSTGASGGFAKETYC